MERGWGEVVCRPPRQDIATRAKPIFRSDTEYTEKRKRERDKRER
jgi:hypothetical protein